MYLDGPEFEEALKQQEIHSEENAKTGLILEYLDKLLPDNWYDLDMYERRQYINQGDDFDTIEATMRRDKTCVLEIWCELFNGDPRQLTPLHSREINDILRSLKGWERAKNPLNFGGAYGRQRAYIRKEW